MRCPFIAFLICLLALMAWCFAYIGRLASFLLATIIVIPLGLLLTALASMKEELVTFYPEWKEDLIRVIHGESFL